MNYKLKNYIVKPAICLLAGAMLSGCFSTGTVGYRGTRYNNAPEGTQGVKPITIKGIDEQLGYAAQTAHAIGKAQTKKLEGKTTDVFAQVPAERKKDNLETGIAAGAGVATDVALAIYGLKKSGDDGGTTTVDTSNGQLTNGSSTATGVPWLGN